jgi:hypothetical protein
LVSFITFPSIEMNFNYGSYLCLQCQYWSEWVSEYWDSFIFKKFKDFVLSPSAWLLSHPMRGHHFSISHNQFQNNHTKVQ